MTILDAKSLLFNHFSKNHSFSIDDNYRELIPVSFNDDLDKSIVLAALEDMIKADLIRECDKHFVLSQSLENYNQTVVLTRPTITAIVELLNHVAEQLKSDELLPDPLNLKEKDLQNIIILLQNALKEQK